MSERPDMPYRYYANRLPDNRKTRKELADIYRRLRKDHPVLARRMFLVYRAAVLKLREQMDAKFFAC